MIDLLKHEVVVGMVFATNESVCMRYYADEDASDGYPMVFFPRATWEDMGEPQEITVTLEPGDRLNV